VAATAMRDLISETAPSGRIADGAGDLRRVAGAATGAGTTTASTITGKVRTARGAESRTSAGVADPMLGVLREGMQLRFSVFHGRIPPVSINLDQPDTSNHTDKITFGSK
jgi:hypothetical protein